MQIERSEILLYESPVYAEGNIHIGDAYIIGDKRVEIPFELNSILRINENKAPGQRLQLLEMKKHIDHSNQVSCLYGPKGIGKTTLAKLFVTQFREQYSYLAWINAEQYILSASQDLILIDRLGIKEDIHQFENHEHKETLSFQLIISRLGQLKPKEDRAHNLLIIDDFGKNDYSLCIANKQMIDLLNINTDWKTLIITDFKLEGMDHFTINFPSLDPQTKIDEREFYVNQMIKLDYQIRHATEPTETSSLEKRFLKLIPDNEYDKYCLFSLLSTMPSPYTYELLTRCYQLLPDIQYFKDRYWISIHIGKLKTDTAITFLKKVRLTEPNLFVKIGIQNALNMFEGTSFEDTKINLL